MPQARVGPVRLLTRRILIATVLLLITTLVVYTGRSGYLDTQQGGELGLFRSLYYASVNFTTGYGDILPVTTRTRAVDIFVIAPLRIAFWILLVGTTMEAFTETSRQAFRIQRWRNRVRDHTIVVGYSTKGKAAVRSMLNSGTPPGKIVVIDTDQTVLDHAKFEGLVTILGDATRSDFLRLASAAHAKAIIVAVGRDDTAALVTLTANELAPNAVIVASIREAENQHLLEQSGADSVVVSSETAGRLLGIAAITPKVVEVIENLLTPEGGFTIAEREVDPSEVGGSARHLRDVVLGVVREGQLLRISSTKVDVLEPGDRLLYVRDRHRYNS